MFASPIQGPRAGPQQSVDSSLCRCMWARCGLRVSQQPSFRVAVPAHCTPALQQLRGVREMAEPMVDAEGIATSIAEVNANIAAAFGRASVPPPRLPRLVAVSKTKPRAAIAAAYAAGQRCFGENYVQELVEKANDPASPHDIQWHFIGTLQSNKAKIVAAVPNLAMIETVTSMKLAKLLEKAVAGSDRATPLAVMVQLNTSGEVNKGGVEPDQCSGVVSAILKECPHLKFAGLMTIGQYGRVTAAGEVNPDFALLVKSRDELCEALGLDAAGVEVSMGMSGDYEHAIEVGSTNVRVGSSIFGAREKKP